MTLPGLQQPVPQSLIEQILANYDRLEERVRELEKLRQPPAHYIFKPFGEEAPEVGDGALIWPVPKDVDGLKLDIAEAGYSLGGSDETEISIENVTKEVLLFVDNLIINSGDEHSDDSTPEVDIDHAFNQVFWRDKISINIINAPSDALGLSVTLGFV